MHYAIWFHFENQILLSDIFWVLRCFCVTGGVVKLWLKEHDPDSWGLPQRLSHLAQRATETKHPSNSESWCIISRSSLPTEQLHNWFLILLSEVLLPSVITDRIEAFITKSKAKITFERSCDVNILCDWKTFLDCVELIHVTLNAVYTLVLFNV